MTLPDAGALFVLLLRATAILAAAWAIARSRWCGSASIRHVVWLTALSACLLSPAIGALLPSIHLPLPGITPLSGPASIPVALVPAVRDAPTHTVEAIDGVDGGRSVGDAGEGARKLLRDIDWGKASLAMWLTGAFLRLVWLGVLHARTRRLSGRALALNGHARLRPLLEEVSHALGLRGRVPVLVSPDVRMPLAWGIRRPVILLPSEAPGWSDERLRVVLLHELAHVRRRDYGTSLLCELACLIYWPTPLVWVARRQLRAEQERACDDRVLSHGVSPLAYADHLLAIARAFYGSRWELEGVVTMAREVSLKQRVRAILDNGTDRSSIRSAGGLTVSFVALGLYVTLSTLSGSKPTPASGSPPVAASNAVAASPAGAPGKEVAYLWMEAEAGVREPNAYPSGDLDASNVEYVTLEPAASRMAGVSMEANLDITGEYFIWARASAVDADPAGLTLVIDGDFTSASRLTEIKDETAADGWRWLRFAGPLSGETGRFGGMLLHAGRHRVELAAAGDEVRVDRLLFTTDASFTPEAKGPASSARPVYHLVEAEQGTSAGRIRGGRDAYASGSSFVVFREGRGAKPDGTVEFNFDIPVAGRYLIWGRTFAADEKSNSFHLSLDGGPDMIWDLPAADAGDDGPVWAWDPVSTRLSADRRIDPVAFDIDSGPHILRIRTREGGAYLDALLITSDLENRPDGLWPEALPARPTRLEISAEAARLTAPMALRNDPLDGQPYLAVDEEGRARSPGGSGLAVFEFEASEAGLYSVWARTIAPSSEEDSFWIRINGGEWTLWNGIPRSSEWSWAAIRDADAEGRLLQLRLDPGMHTLEIAGREGGLRLDRLLVTNDPLFRPG